MRLQSLSPLVVHQKDARHRLAWCSPYIAEFVGCSLQALAWNSVELGKVDMHAQIWKPVVVGLTVMVSTYCFASISGAHLNPAVSFAVGLSNKGIWYNLYKYMLAQFCGNFAGVGLSCAIYGKAMIGNLGPKDGFHIGQVWVVEFGFTALLCFIFLNVTLSRRNNPVEASNQFYALAIGLAMLAGVASCEDISGAILNPGLALAVDAQHGRLGYGVSYAITELMAAFVASVAFRIVRPYEEHGCSRFENLVQEAKVTMNASKLCSEGIGTFMVVVTFGLTASSKTYAMLRPVAAGAALASCHYAVGDVSGGYFNPAVTLSVIMNGRKKLEWFHGACYIGVQIVCAAFGCVMFQGVYPSPLDVMVKDKVKINGVAQGYQEASAIALVFAFLVCYVCLATQTVTGISTPLTRNTYSGLAYAFSSAAGGLVLLHLSNALANPALMLGEGLTTSVVKWHRGVAFWEAFCDFLHSFLLANCQFFGALLASIIFRVTHAEEFEKYFDELVEKNVAEEAPLLLQHEVKSA